MARRCRGEIVEGRAVPADARRARSAQPYHGGKVGRVAPRALRIGEAHPDLTRSFRPCPDGGEFGRIEPKHGFDGRPAAGQDAWHDAMNFTNPLLAVSSLLWLAAAASAFPDDPAAPGSGARKPEPAAAAPGRPTSGTYSSLDWPMPNEALMPPGTVALADADLPAAFALYERISGRSIIPGGRLPQPRLSYRIEKAMPRRELLQALDTLLSQHGVTLMVMGTNFMKAVNEAEASREAAPEVALPAELLPDSNTYIQFVVRLEHRGVNSAMPILQPLVRLPNSLMTMPASNSLVVRDYSANVRRVLSVLRRFDVPDDGREFEEPPRRPR